MKDLASCMYLHIPFCVRKCPYCSFYSKEHRTSDIDTYIDALIRQIQWAAADDTTSLDTLYFGGGTPSLLSAFQVERVLKAVDHGFGFNRSCEITLEANPKTADEKKLKHFFQLGINRLSVGIQSFQPQLLQFLERVYTADEARYFLDAAIAAGFDNLACDLMLGLLDQTEAMVMDDINTLLNFGARHISIYSLSLDEGTKFYKQYANADNDLVAPACERAMYHTSIAKLLSEGFLHYEISNLALPGYESRHNLCYWTGQPYGGFGAAAHGYEKNVRYGIVADIDLYIRALSGARPNLDQLIDEKVVIDDDEAKREYLLLGFRLIQGVDKHDFHKRFGQAINEIFFDEVTSLLDEGLIEENETHYFLSSRGLDFANRVFSSFV